jgi:hypothetical protein
LKLLKQVGSTFDHLKEATLYGSNKISSLGTKHMTWHMSFYYPELTELDVIVDLQINPELNMSFYDQER